MQTLPLWLSIGFIGTVLVTVAFFYKAAHATLKVLIVLLTWFIFHSVLALTQFFTVTDAIPPRIIVLMGPVFLCIILLFSTSKGRTFLDQLDPKMLTLLHIVRIPVEILLWGLCIYKAIPEIMTFEGQNFDILSGITAPFVYFWGYKKPVLSKNILLLWNFLCLFLLLNIVITAVLAAPLPFQQLAFEQPNIAVLYFPFVSLPGLVVPLVLLSHLVCIRQLLKPTQP